MAFGNFLAFVAFADSPITGVSQATGGDFRPYIDQLIDPSQAEELYDLEYRQQLEQPLGRRTYSTEFIHFQEDQDSFGDSAENGVRLRWGRETLNMGDFTMDATLRSDRPAQKRPDDNSDGGVFTIRQHGFAVTDGWLMENTGGVLRGDSDTLLASSFRLNLPSSLVFGLKSQLHNEKQSVRFSAGRIGRLGTGHLSEFATTDGELYQLGYSQHAGEAWYAGAHLIDVRNSSEIENHQSAAVVAQYARPGTKNRYQLHGLFDSKGKQGIWLDGDTRVGRWRHRYGLFHLDPDLLWTDASVANDQRGFYSRSELRRTKFYFTGGLDFLDTDITDKLDRTGSRRASGFISGTYKLRSKTSFGGGMDVRKTKPRAGGNGDDNHEVRLNSFISKRHAIGTTRVQWFASDIAQGDRDAQGYGISWDQSWNVHSALQLSTTLSHEMDRGISEHKERSIAGMLIRNSRSSRLRWHGDLTFTRLKDQGTGIQDGINAGVSVFWKFRPRWEATVRLDWNQLNGQAISGVDPDFTDQEKSILVSIRHTKTRGRPFTPIGKTTGANGYGEISGQVFFDENRDGERQPDEPLARGVFVYLDGRYETRTDREGRYSFAPVQAGGHVVSLAVEDLPLPWGLDDETPRPARVVTRGRSRVDFGLTRVDQQFAQAGHNSFN